MNTLVHLGLLNAVLATFLALLALAARFLCRRPALVHALWLLVLLKLLTPPFLALPITWLPSPESATPPPAAKAVPSVETSAEGQFGSFPRAPVVAELRQASEDVTRPSTMAMPDTPDARTPDPAPEPTDWPIENEVPAPTPVSEGPAWEQTVASVWLTGSILWWAVAGLRVYRF